MYTDRCATEAEVSSRVPTVVASKTKVQTVNLIAITQVIHTLFHDWLDTVTVRCPLRSIRQSTELKAAT